MIFYSMALPIHIKNMRSLLHAGKPGRIIFGHMHQPAEGYLCTRITLNALNSKAPKIQGRQHDP